MESLLKRIQGSVAFIPSLIALGFGLFAIILIFVPKVQVNSEVLKFIYVENKSDIQFILTFTIGGILTLTVFSFSMVMTTINQSISSYSPRIIPLLLSANDNQYILGFTSGTVVYSLVMSLFLVNTKILEFPKLAAFLAIFFCVISVVLFIYFIHSVTQSIHINHLLRQSFTNTRNNLEYLKTFETINKDKVVQNIKNQISIRCNSCGYMSMPNFKKLSKLANKFNLEIYLSICPGNFVYDKDKICFVSGKTSPKIINKIIKCFKIDKSEPMNVPAVGIKHLVEVAIRASAPGEKDVGTSIAAIHYLTQLFIYRQELGDFYLVNNDDNEMPSVYFEIISFDTLISYSFKEMEAYMKDDPVLMEQLKLSLNKIKNFNKNKNEFNEVLSS